MIQTYKVWHPDDEGPEDAQEIDGVSPDDVAERYAASIFTPGYSDSLELMVSDECGNEYEVTVDIEWEPTFMAYSQKRKKGK